MVRTKDKKAKGDDAFKTQKQKIGKKKLAPATATRAEVHARTLRIVKPRDEVITPESIGRKRNANEFLTSKADATQRVSLSAQAGGAGWEKHRPEKSLHENLHQAAHYREATRASAFTALNTTVDHFAASISPSQFMQVLNVTLGAVTDTGMDVREKALALFMKLLKLFPPPMTSDGVRHIMTYIRIALTHSQPGVRRSGIKMLGAFTKQWPGAVRRAYATPDSATAAKSGSAADVCSIVTESALSNAVASSPFVVISGDCGSNNTASFLKSSEIVAHGGGVLNGTAGGVSSGTPNTYIADSNNGGNAVEVVGIYDTATRAKTFDIEQIIEWATEVAVSAPVIQQHRMMPVIATLLEECLPFRDHIIATGDALLSSLSSDSKAEPATENNTNNAAAITLPVAYVERYFKKFASKWSIMWKELMELGYKMFRDAIIVERITAVGRCFAACTIYLHRHGRLFTNHYNSGGGTNSSVTSGKASRGSFFTSQLNQPFDPRWMLRELFLFKVPFSMKELTTGNSNRGDQNGAVSMDASAATRMTTLEQHLRGPLMDRKSAATIATSICSRSKATLKFEGKGQMHLTVVPSAKAAAAAVVAASQTKSGDASNLTVFDAFQAVANVSASRLRIAEVITWCLLPIASDKQEQLKCNAIISGNASSFDQDSSPIGNKRGRGRNDRRDKKKASRGEEKKSTEAGEENADVEEIDEIALGKPDLEVDEKDSDEEVDLDDNDNAATGEKKTKIEKKDETQNKSTSSGKNSQSKINDNVAQAKRLVRTFIESPSCPLSSAVQILRALLAMYPHLYPTIGVTLIGSLLGRVQPILSSIAPITISATSSSTTAAKSTASAKVITPKAQAAEEDGSDDSSSESDSDSEKDGGEAGDDKHDRERNASAAHGSQCGRDLKELIDLVSTAMNNRYVLTWPQRVAVSNAAAAPTAVAAPDAAKPKSLLPIEQLGGLLRQQVPKTLFCLRNFSAPPASLPPAHSNAYNNAARRQIAMAHDRVATLGAVLRCAVHTYHDAVTMRHPALYHSATADSTKEADAALRKALSTLIELRMKRPAASADEAAAEDLVMEGPLRRLADPVLVGLANGTLRYLGQ